MKTNKILSEDTIYLAVKLLSLELIKAQEENNDQYEMRIKNAIKELEK